MAPELGRPVKTSLKRLEEPLALYSVGVVLCLVALVPFLFLAGEVVVGGPKVMSQSLAIVVRVMTGDVFKMMEAVGIKLMGKIKAECDSTEPPHSRGVGAHRNR